ncbi:MAG: excinuclease ABC subunit A, partial [Ottowia sp.]|nr:excinuclease ABC subunit A [Ottowia sp.]
YGVPTDVPLRELSAEHRAWLFEGDPTWVSWQKSWPRKWYGVRHFFDWLEGKAYKMHIRVLLSRYRSYTVCPACHGARLKPAAHAWRLGASGASIAEMMAMPVEAALAVVRDFAAQNQDAALARLLEETVQRLGYLCEVGLGYLTLERQARTLSGGELQRINLTTALGTALVNTLFVFDEPSAGLHPNDAGRILGIMQRLRDAGNTLVVVEHDAQFLRAADWLIELGPGAGAGGGQIVAQATPAELAAHANTLTGEYLAGRKQVAPPAVAALLERFAASVRLAGVQFRNLQDVSLDIPLDRLTVLVGVSGSGKSTLVEDVLYPALLRHFRQGDAPAPSADEAGAPLAGVTLAFAGAAKFRRVVLVDQSPIGKSARACPASHVGAWERIRRRFTALPLARERGYTLGTFSFNSGNGRCPACGGSGFEHIEMQFLSDVWLRCPDCDGRRYRPEILEVTLHGKNIADVLALTVREAVEFFHDDAAIVAALEPLLAVGLDYLQLGQPTPTLSGGEAQRLKLAATGLAAGQDGRSLFLFDEPSTGLHPHDIAALLAVFRRLLDGGHSVLVIEHNLEIMRAADWLIELGPGAGEHGGRLVAQGTPEQLAAHADSPTGQALRAAKAARTGTALRVAEARPPAYGVRPVIAVRNAREHNLRHLDVDIPRDVLTVITGLSGSGKS